MLICVISPWTRTQVVLAMVPIFHSSDLVFGKVNFYEEMFGSGDHDLNNERLGGKNEENVNFQVGLF